MTSLAQWIMMVKAAKKAEIPPDNEIWYWAPEQVTLYTQAGVQSHAFADGKGIITITPEQVAKHRTEQWLRGQSTASPNALVTRIALPAHITNISLLSFRGCINLALTALPAGVTRIGSYAFSDCTSLVLTALPAGITNIDTFAFQNCPSLALTSLPAGLTSIGNRAFYGCTSLALTELPAGLTSIGFSAFHFCPGITITELPIGLTSIGNNAFLGCTGMLNLTVIPEAVETIGGQALRRIWNTAERTGTLTFNGTPTSIGLDVFMEDNYLTDIYVPWAEGAVANAPWGATNATIHYNHTGGA